MHAADYDVPATLPIEALRRKVTRIFVNAINPGMVVSAEKKRGCVGLV
jgi:hypothetical protein